MTRVHIIGSGVAGLTCAYYLQQLKVDVSLTTASAGPDASCCSWWAGGMLAPYCEQQTAEPLIGKLGLEGMSFWREFAQHSELDYKAQGTLVVAQDRELSDIRHFERVTSNSQRLDADGIKEVEPELGHFSNGLFFPEEAHITPRVAIVELWNKILKGGADINTEKALTEKELVDSASQYDWLIDCRGLAANNALDDLRGVKGEMLHLFSSEIQLRRPIRLLHPRYPLYIVPREGQQFMVGATTIEANNGRRVSVRSALELMSAAFTVHPAFAEAEIVEIGVDFRPAFDDNLPRIRRYGNSIYVNGLYRHGFLIAPALARRAVDVILNKSICNEVVDANFP